MWGNTPFVKEEDTVYLRNRPEPPATYMMQSVKHGVESGIFYKRYGPDAVRSIDSVLQTASISEI